MPSSRHCTPSWVTERDSASQKKKSGVGTACAGHRVGQKGGQVRAIHCSHGHTWSTEEECVCVCVCVCVQSTLQIFIYITKQKLDLSLKYHVHIFIPENSTVNSYVGLCSIDDLANKNAVGS